MYNKFWFFGIALAFVFWLGLSFYERRKDRQRLEKLERRIRQKEAGARMDQATDE